MASIDDISPELLRKALKEKIDLGHNMLAMLSNNELKQVQGIPKLEKKVKQEVKFLEKFEDGKKFLKLKKEHINCSNLVHLDSFISQIFLVNKPTAVMHPFNLCREDGSVIKKVVVDIVCEEGHTWVKVVARNPKALDLNSQGGNQFGQKSILDQVKEFVLCASQNEVLFKPPAVKFVFANGVTKNLHKRIAKRGAEAVGEVVDIGHNETDDEESDADESDCDSEFDSEADVVSDTDTTIDNTKINLDITAMIAYVSALTNGRNWFQFSEKILSQQAEWERKSPVKPFLDNIFKDKELICCESAMRDFETIIATLGGPGERERASLLIKRITVVPDWNSPRTINLELSSKIKDRSKCIFGTGDSLKVLTVTANTGFVRAAQGQGVAFAVITHQSRALTEDKEKLAVNV